jgi:adenylosuccinate lyase
MPARDIFANISPLDHRYLLANGELFELLAAHLSENGRVRTCVRVELALLAELVALDPSIPDREAIARALADLERQGIPPEEVNAEEEKTRHDLRALVNVLKRRVPAAVRPLVHLGATSYDIRDTAAALQVRGALREAILPLLLRLERVLIELARREAATPQVGRTHGQFAVPITFGFAMAEYVSRLGKSIERLEARTGDLRGKLAGAVGAYNATGLIVRDPRGFEARVLGRLGLRASDHSTQIVEPEYLLLVLLELNTAFGILANLADDLRSLQRSEIDEVREGFADTQVGSSTMPQKRNPWNSEHVKSLWKAFAPRVVTFFMDQVSEHQRDLTNSASSRFVAEYLAGFAAAANRMLSVLQSLEVARDRMASNLDAAGDTVLAEAAYILLAIAGETEAHEVLRRAAREGAARGRRLVEVLHGEPQVWERLRKALAERGAVDPEAFFARPAAYSGLASQVALDTAVREERRMEAVTARLAGGAGA